jgi:hypothetical protein
MHVRQLLNAAKLSRTSGRQVSGKPLTILESKSRQPARRAS